MKQPLLFTALVLAALAGYARIELSDILKWGLARRAELPSEGYRMICTTNRTPSYAWVLNGAFDVDNGGMYSTAFSASNLVIPGLPKTLVMDGMNGMVPVPDTGYMVGAFSDGMGMSGVGLLDGMSPFSSAGCYTPDYSTGSSFTLSYYGIGNYYYGYVTLTRTDYPDIVTVTTNYVATGGGAVLRDYLNPRKFARLENGVFKIYEIVDVPSHWEFGGVDCPELTFPITAFSGTAAGYTWSTMGDSMFQMYIYQDMNLLWLTDTLTPDPAIRSVHFTGQNGTPDRSLIYVSPSVVTNSL